MNKADEDQLFETVNALAARVGALEKLVVADIGERWSEPRVDAWFEIIAAANDEAAPGLGAGEGYWATALHKLGKRLKLAIRSRSDRT